MRDYGPNQDPETRAIRELLLYGKNGAAAKIVRGLLLKSLMQASGNFAAIQTLALKSDSSQDPQWRNYMHPLGEDPFAKGTLAHDWFVTFAAAVPAREAPKAETLMRDEFQNAYLAFGQFFILAACKHLAHELRTKKAFLTAADPVGRKKEGISAFGNIYGKTQVYAGLEALGYQISEAMAADVPAYLGALWQFSKALNELLPDSSEGETLRSLLCKADLVWPMCRILEKRRLTGAQREALTKEHFKYEVTDLLETLEDRRKTLLALRRDNSSAKLAAAVDAYSLTANKETKHNPRRILSALNLYYAAVFGAAAPEDADSDAFDPHALQAVPWVKLGFRSTPITSLNSTVGEDGDDLVDILDSRTIEGQAGWEELNEVEQLIDSRRVIPNLPQGQADQHLARHFGANDQSGLRLGKAILHRSLPDLKRESPGDRNAFLVKWRDAVNFFVEELTNARSAGREHSADAETQPVRSTDVDDRRR